jgi:hypothetical protein
MLNFNLILNQWLTIICFKSRAAKPKNEFFVIVEFFNQKPHEDRNV